MKTDGNDPDLHHLGVDVEARVAQLGDLLGQKLHPLGRVTKDDRLVDLKLREKAKQTGIRHVTRVCG